MPIKVGEQVVHRHKQRDVVVVRTGTVVKELSGGRVQVQFPAPVSTRVDLPVSALEQVSKVYPGRTKVQSNPVHRGIAFTR